MEETADILISFGIEKELNSLNPNYDNIRNIIIKAFNKQESKDYDLKIGLTSTEEDEVIQWMIKNLVLSTHPLFYKLFTKRTEVKVPFFSISLSSKINDIAQYHCPICKPKDGKLHIIPIRISAISKQAVIHKPQIRKAFERALKSKFENHELGNFKNDKLCVLILFILGKNNRNKDLDNMSKALMDGLEGILFESDMDIDHSNLIKFYHQGDEDYCYVNIRRSSLNKNDDVMFEKMAHGWLGQKFLNLEDFLQD